MRNNKTIQLNEGVIQWVAIEVFFIALLGAYLDNVFLFALLSLDFFIRGFTNLPMSFLKKVAILLNAKLLTKNKMVFAPPKLFAARIGFFICIGIETFIYLHLPFHAKILEGLLLICAFLEGFFIVCVGCYVYQLLFVTFRGRQ